MFHWQCKEHILEMAQDTKQSTKTVERLAVRCIALKDGQLCKAVCIDLGLYVQSATLREAMSELEALIRSYAQDAQETGISPERLLRPIPKEARARLYAKLFWAELRAWLGDLLGRGRRNGSSATHETRLCYL